ncbi:MAG: hypothetical protein KJ077_33685 [Anaerolineae bacterium]|nr:hypothetical protein [Anaerolineae bacterium]
MEWVTDQYLQDDDCLSALNEAMTRLGTAYYLGIAKNEVGQLGVGILDISKNEPDPSLVQFIPVAEPGDLARMVRVYSEVYGCLAANLDFEYLTPRGQAIVLCKQAGEASRTDAELAFYGRVALFAHRVGVKDAEQILGIPPNYAALEARLAEIKYLALTLEMPAEAARRTLSLSKEVLESLNIIRVRPVPEE